MRGSAACRSFRRTTVSAASGTTKRPAGDPGRREAAKGPLDPPRLFKHARRESSKFHGRSMRVFSFTATLPKVIPSGWVRGVDSMIRATWKPSLLVEKTKGTVAGQ